jgi:tetratricopeptide (TPR) repeat protein
MSVSEALNQAINWPRPPDLWVGAGLAVGLIVVAGVLLYLGKLRWLGRTLGGAGCALLLAVLLALQLQTVTDRSGPSVVATRPRYPERTRMLARSALFALPGAAGVVLASLWIVNRRWLRSQVPRHLKAGRKHFVKKEYDAALCEYNQAIEAAPHLGEAYCRRGCVYQAMGDTTRALADFDHAIRADPRLSKAYLERGKIHTDSGDIEAALEDFGRLLVLRAEDPELYLNRGLCFLKQGATEEAIADFQRVLKLTNHTDYADPAKNFLRQLGDTPIPSTHPAAAPNGPPAPQEPTTPRAEDYVL